MPDRPPKTSRLRIPSRRVAAACVLLLVLPACRSTPPLGLPDDRREPYSAYRPRYDRPPRRTLFLSGYAGYNYGPIFGRNTIPTPNGGEVWAVPISSRAASIRPSSSLID
ncbi:MAG: hypothetical protein KatS3mg108_0871 [Isosphaeraceae bacterium]|nr:MAG: hypothetical protein KatS3mg108_0871 [Isosphaeraceae bacterium]